MTTEHEDVGNAASGQQEEQTTGTAHAHGEGPPLSLYAFAREALRLKFSVVPTVPGEKRPAGKWKQHQKTLPTLADLRRGFPPEQEGIGLITGKVSGNVEVLDFDAHVTRALFYELAERVGLGPLVTRLRDGYEDKTPNGGHLLYRCEQIAGNQKLALVVERDDTGEVLRDEKGKPLVKTIIETRGERGFIVIPPSAGATHPTGKPYVQKSGGLATIATISREERESLLALARSFNEVITAAKSEKHARTKPGGTRPGDLFNAHATWDEVLTPHGWAHVFDHGDVGYWRRPGKEDGPAGACAQKVTV